MNDVEIEELLRMAPRPKAPAGLLSRLTAGVRLPQSQNERSHIDPIPFWRRWAPALAFGVVLLTCCVLLAVQTNQLFELRRENRSLRVAAADLQELRGDNAELLRRHSVSEEAQRTRRERAELIELRSEAVTLRAEAQELSAARAENERLKAEHAAAVARAGVAEEDPFAIDKERAKRVACISNIKQIGLAARMWENDNKKGLPADFTTMSNELSTPKILTCPADAARQRAATWAEFDASKVSYEMLSPGATASDPDVVYVRCPIHNNVGLIDGSAHQLGDQSRVVKVDGKFKVVHQ